mmetsp:Transcript_65707/g.181806  ORF Transcript_65707/g.181806 Transcript_65707/m.181806 type:complete len:209 (-) Transcript_65707:557-1183(-)
MEVGCAVEGLSLTKVGPVLHHPKVTEVVGHEHSDGHATSTVIKHDARSHHVATRTISRQKLQAVVRLSPVDKVHRVAYVAQTDEVLQHLHAHHVHQRIVEKAELLQRSLGGADASCGLFVKLDVEDLELSVCKVIGGARTQGKVGRVTPELRHGSDRAVERLLNGYPHPLALFLLFLFLFRSLLRLRIGVDPVNGHRITTSSGGLGRW